MATAQWIFDRVAALYPAQSPPKAPDFESWANIIRLMRERDGRTDGQIRALFDAANRDGFWLKNIRCPEKLREKWDELTLKLMGSKNGKPQGNGGSASDARVRQQDFSDVQVHSNEAVAADS